jgi:drug/metabolite transporter (DMT)-like permease
MKFLYIYSMNVYVVLGIQILFASATHIVAKSVVRDVDALTLTFLRGIISAIGFFVVLVARRVRIRFRKEHFRSIYFLGFLATFNQFLYLYGMKYTTAANGALLYAATPIFVLLLSGYLLKEEITFRKLSGIFLAFLGVTIVIFERGISASAEFTFGNIVILIAVITWALFTILGKPLVLQLGALSATASANFAGLLLFLPFGIYGASTFPFEQLHSSDWAGILYLGIGTSVIGYLLWYYALRRIDASRLAVFSNGQPIVASIMSVIFLDASISRQFVIGGIITIAGVILAPIYRGTIQPEISSFL